MTPKIVVSMAVLSLVGTAQAQTETLNITENSSSSLTAVLNGSPLTVLNPAPNSWSFVSPATGTSFAEWAEPGETTVNFINLDPTTGIMLIGSDISGIAGLTPQNNGATDITDFHVSGGATLDVIFTDNGDSSSTVPDAVATFELLSLSLAALGTMAKVRPLIFRPFNG